MKGGSEKSEILCAGQLATAEAPLWGKYRPNISLSYIVRKYMQSVFRAIFNWSSKFIHILPATCLN